MEQHKVGDLLLFRDRNGKKTLGFIESIKESGDFDSRLYYCYWFGTLMEDISTEQQYQIDQFKRNLQEYMLGIKV